MSYIHQMLFSSSWLLVVHFTVRKPIYLDFNTIPPPKKKENKNTSQTKVNSSH